MKKLILTTTLIILSTQNSYSTTIKNLEVICNMKAKVTEVHDIKYNKGLPAQGRFGGIDPSLGFKSNLEILSKDPGCEALTEKYRIFLGTLSAFGGISPAIESETYLISELKNQIVDLKLNQQIGFQLAGGYLPLFPLVHEESLSLSFKVGKISGTVALPFDLNWVYSVNKLENFSDIEKLSLAEKITTLAFKGDFHSLMLKLEPHQTILKKSYAQLIWKSFKQYADTPYANQVLQFHVGGEGSFTGAPLAVKLNKISHIPDLFTSAEIVQLLSDFPTWILAGYSGNDCLNFSEKDLEIFLESALLKLPIMSQREKSLLKDPMVQIAGPVHFVSSCTEGKVSEKAKAAALEILNSLKTF